MLPKLNFGTLFASNIKNKYSTYTTMFCKCKNNDRFRFQFGIGQIYSCYWVNESRTHVVVTRTWPSDSVIMDIVDFLHTFDYWY